MLFIRGRHETARLAWRAHTHKLSSTAKKERPPSGNAEVVTAILKVANLVAHGSQVVLE